MKRMIDNKKLIEIEASGGTQWYSHKLKKANGTSVTFVLPFEKNLFDFLENPNENFTIFGVLLKFGGPSINDINENATFPVLVINHKAIYCSTIKSDGSLARANINITDFIIDEVNKYQVF